MPLANVSQFQNHSSPGPGILCELFQSIHTFTPFIESLTGRQERVGYTDSLITTPPAYTIACTQALKKVFLSCVFSFQITCILRSS